MSMTDWHHSAVLGYAQGTLNCYSPFVENSAKSFKPYCLTTRGCDLHRLLLIRANFSALFCWQQPDFPRFYLLFPFSPHFFPLLSQPLLSSPFPRAYIIIMLSAAVLHGWLRSNSTNNFFKSHKWAITALSLTDGSHLRVQRQII